MLFRSLWRSCLCCLNCFLLLGQRASSCTFDHLFVRLPSLCLGVCLLCTRLSTHFSAFHSVIVCAGDIRLLLKLLLKFRHVLKHTESRSSFAWIVIKISKKTSPQRWTFSFALKRNETKRNINRSSTKTSTYRASSILRRTGYHV